VQRGVSSTPAADSLSQKKEEFRITSTLEEMSLIVEKGRQGKKRRVQAGEEG